MSFKFSHSDILSASQSNVDRENNTYLPDSLESLLNEKEKCIICGCELRSFESCWEIGDSEATELIVLNICLQCGWFYLRKDFNNWIYCQFISEQRVASFNEDIVNTLPIYRLQKELLKNWDKRKQLSPKQAEDIAKNIFKDHLDCDLHYRQGNVFSKDGGIDFVLVESNAGIEYAFQIKRRLTDKKESIKVVREFLGSMMLQGFNRGYFVSFSNGFSSDTYKEINENSRNLKTQNLELGLFAGDDLLQLIKNHHSTIRKTHGLLSIPCSRWIQVNLNDFHNIAIKYDRKTEKYYSSQEIVDLIK